MGAQNLGLRGIQGRFYQKLETITADSWAGRIAMKVDTDQSQETYKWLGMTPAMRQWIGGRQAKGLRDTGITIVNSTYENTLEINVDELRRDKTGQINVRIDDLAGRTAEHWSKLLSDLLVTPGNAYDATAYFGTAHIEGASGTQVNACTASHITTLDIATAAVPTGAEMRTNILGAAQYMMGYKDDQGEPLNANAREFMIMVPTNMWASTMEAISVPTQIVSGAAVANPLIYMDGFRFSAVINPRLSSTTTWYMFRTDASAKPFIMQDELFETGMEDQTFLNNRILFGVKAIRAVGTGFWQYAVKCTNS